MLAKMANELGGPCPLTLGATGTSLVHLRKGLNGDGGGRWKNGIYEEWRKSGRDHNSNLGCVGLGLAAF